MLSYFNHSLACILLSALLSTWAMASEESSNRELLQVLKQQVYEYSVSASQQYAWMSERIVFVMAQSSNIKGCKQGDLSSCLFGVLELERARTFFVDDSKLNAVLEQLKERNLSLAEAALLRSLKVKLSTMVPRDGIGEMRADECNARARVEAKGVLKVQVAVANVACREEYLSLPADLNTLKADNLQSRADLLLAWIEGLRAKVAAVHKALTSNQK